MSLIPAQSDLAPRGNAEVREWMDHCAPALHPAFSPPTSLADQRASPAKSKALDNFSLDFCQIVQRYEESTNPKRSRSKFDIRAAHSWDEVMEAAKFAEAKYLEDAKGSKGIVRRFFRVVGNNASTLTPWVDLLPNDQYLSILCGGLKLILGVAAQRSEKRVQILDAFDRVPDTVLKTQRCHELFPNDLVIRDHATELYQALLEMIEGMIASLVDKTAWARIKDGLKGKLAEKDLGEKIDRCKKVIQELQDRVDYLQLSTLVSANASVSRMEPRVMRAEEAGIRTKHLTEGIDYRTSIIQMSIEDIGQGLGGMRTDISRQLEHTTRMSEQIGVSTEATKNLASILQGILDFAEWNSKRLEAQVQSLVAVARSRTPQPLGYGRENLLKLLAIDEQAASSELTFMLRQAQSIEVEAQGPSRWLLRSSRFQDWLCSGKSDILSVDGNSEQFGMARCSPMTLMCALLAQSLSKRDETQVIHFFCGAHNTSNDTLYGPLGLIKSLIVQLLTLNDFDLTLTHSRPWQAHLANQDLPTLCSLLHHLAAQLPPRILLCIIDGISLFEKDQWRTQIELIIWKLREVAADPTMRVVMKILITSPGISRFVRDLVNPQDRIWIPRDASGEGKLLTGGDLALERNRMLEPGRGTGRGFGPGARDDDDDGGGGGDVFEHGCE